MEVTHIGYFYFENDLALKDPEFFLMSLREGNKGLCVDKYGVSRIKDIKTTGDSIGFTKEYIPGCCSKDAFENQITYSGRRNDKKYVGNYSYLNADKSQEKGNTFLLESLANPSCILNEIATSLEKKFGFSKN